jgi:hypothetical protein
MQCTYIQLQSIFTFIIMLQNWSVCWIMVKMLMHESTINKTEKQKPSGTHISISNQPERRYTQYKNNSVA